MFVAVYCVPVRLYPTSYVATIPHIHIHIQHVYTYITRHTIIRNNRRVRSIYLTSAHVWRISRRRRYRGRAPSLVRIYVCIHAADAITLLYTYTRIVSAILLAPVVTMVLHYIIAPLYRPSRLRRISTRTLVTVG